MANYREILESVADGVYFVDRNRRITFWNAAASSISGHDRRTVIHRVCSGGPLQHVDGEGRRLCAEGCPLTAVLADGLPRDGDVLLQHAQGHRVPVHVAVRPLRGKTGDIVGAVETFTDTTAALEARHRTAELERLAFVDVLTGLGNRAFIDRQIASRMGEFARRGQPFGVLMLDLDHFKRVNDTWGHDAGDTVLKTVGRTLAAATRVEEFVGRWGGEEFIALVRASDESGLASVGERYRRMIAETEVRLPEGALRVTVSIGGTVVRITDCLSTLLRRADEHLYRSKREGRDRATVAA
jgi:diguanylate cyclase (GGDEF)-like protein